jgi:hypothetical protein
MNNNGILFYEYRRCYTVFRITMTHIKLLSQKNNRIVLRITLGHATRDITEGFIRERKESNVRKVTLTDPNIFGIDLQLFIPFQLSSN